MTERKVKPSASSRSLRSAFSFMSAKRDTPERRVVSGPQLDIYPEHQNTSQTTLNAETDPRQSLSAGSASAGSRHHARASSESHNPAPDNHPLSLGRTASTLATNSTQAKYRPRTRASSIFSLNSIFRDSQSSRSIASSNSISRPSIHEDPAAVPQDAQSAEYTRKIKSHIANDKGILKGKVGWRRGVDPRSGWTQGTVWISDESLCGASPESRLTETLIQDLRSIRLNANKQTSVIDIAAINGNERVSLQLDSTDGLLRWIAALSVWMCLAGTGIESKRIQPKVVPDTCTGQDPILSCSLQVMGKIVKNKRLSRSIFKASPTMLPQSLQAPTSWVTAQAKLRPNGALDFTTEDQTYSFSTSLAELTRQDAWRIHWSVFQKHHVLYLGSLRKEDEKVVKLDIFALGSSPQKIRRPIDQLTGIYLAFPSEHEYKRWLYVLGNTLRPTYYALASRSFSQTLRSASRLDMRLLHARYKPAQKGTGHVPPPTSFFELSSRGILLGRSCLGRNSRDPFFRDDFVLDSVADVLPLELDCRFVNFDDQPLVGRVRITRELVQGPAVEQWVKIYDVNDGSTLGDVCIKISYFGSNVLAPHQYEHLEAMLKDTDSRLSAKISEARMSLPEYTDMFVKIYSCLGICDQWLMSLIDGEIGKLADKVTADDRSKQVSNLLFRGNTLMTKAIEKYMQLTAHSYLRDLVGKVVRQVLDRDEKLELDPSRLDDGHGITPEIEQLKVHNQERLMAHAETIWVNIRNTIADIPQSLVVVFQYLRQQLEGLHQDEEVVFNGISGFLFLRFICPALLSPKLFGLVHNSPQPEVQRTLTLLAKLMQSFANRANFTAKESFMIPLTPFIENNKKELCQYFRVISNQNKWDEIRMAKPSKPQYKYQQHDIPLRPLPDAPTLPYLYDKYACYQELVEHWLTTVPTSRVNGVGSPIIARAIGDKGGLYQINSLEFEHTTDSFGQDLKALVGSDSPKLGGNAFGSASTVDPVIEAFHNECLRIYTAKTDLEDDLCKAESPLTMEKQGWSRFVSRIHVKWDYGLTGHVDAVNPMTIDVGVIDDDDDDDDDGATATATKRASVQSVGNGTGKRASVQSNATGMRPSSVASVASIKLLNVRGSMVLDDDDRGSMSRSESKLGKWLKKK
ncbi:YALIA101S06e03774g1_1 [Yarrowia lipolytica]|nr:Inhibitory regulator protein BUD2/CLA2 [Yarrowia lipolytica]SEI35175.1 YALIA101S06e03774g1_1 [Yarrowia lipolytica]